MNKFTIFTVVLVIAVVSVIADLSVREYVDSKEGTASVLNSGENSATTASVTDATTAVTTPPTSSTGAIDISAQKPLEPKVLVAPEPSPLTESLIIKSALGEKVTEKHFDGKVYQLLDISSTPLTDVNYFEMSVENIPVASITEIALADEIRAMQLYLLLQNKTKPYIDLSVNETNTYGNRSFYVNHGKKPDEAFLTVQIGKRVYSFAYLKIYHNEVKQLILALQK